MLVIGNKLGIIFFYFIIAILGLAYINSLKIIETSIQKFKLKGKVHHSIVLFYNNMGTSPHVLLNIASYI
jgi:hypothetical protein